MTRSEGAFGPVVQALGTGRTAPLGADVSPGGVNFSVYSRSASGIELVFFDREDDALPAKVLRLDPAENRTGIYWHAFVPDIKPGQLYGYRTAPVGRSLRCFADAIHIRITRSVVLC
jgi:pullulanase/glycogen debranching enzyme